MGFSTAMDVGSGVAGGLGSIMGGYAESREIGLERNILKTQTDLDLKKAKKTTRKAVGAEISRTAGSGVQLDLEDIARLESEYLLDEAVIKDKGRVQDRMLRSEQKTSKRMGWYNAIPSLSSASEGLSGTALGKKFGETGLGAWLQK